MSLFKNRAGQSMVEAIFAIGILLFVVSAVLALTTSNIAGSQDSEFQVVANNLAREGIEVVRSVRDANWLSGQPWNQGLADPGGAQQARIEFNETQNAWSINFNYPDDILYFSPDGVYSHQSTGNTPSIYTRHVTFEQVCVDSSGNEYIAFSCTPGDQQLGIKLTSHVGWAERGRQHEVTLESLLYAWK